MADSDTDVLRGAAVVRGVVLGKASIRVQDTLVVGEFSIPRPMVRAEVARYRSALEKTRRELRVLRQKISSDSSAEIAAFIDAHLMMLKDSVFAVEPVRTIKERCCNAEWALKLQHDALLEVFDDMDDPYLRARKDDVEHVVDRIMRNLQGGTPEVNSVAPRSMRSAVVVADNVSPADLLLMHQQGVSAVVCEYGSVNSHSAILARSLNIPAVFGVRGVLERVTQDQLLIVDGDDGVVYISPGPEIVDYFHARRQEEKVGRARLEALRDETAVSLDGCHVGLSANVDRPDDVGFVVEARADGIGLYRTEMMFLSRAAPMSEEEQYRVYREVVEAMGGAPVTIRTLDIGGDKQMAGMPSSAGNPVNPALGLRAVRWYLRNPELFAQQVRAILRASAHGTVRLLIPMLTTLAEAEHTQRIIRQQKEQLARSGTAFDSEIPVGGMIEVPAAALQAEDLARHLDFLSIGTNDLIQYTLAADRQDEEVSYLCDPLHPAILRLISMVIRAAAAVGVPVSMCGEMAGNDRFTRLLLGLGLREFSMNHSALLRVKQIVRHSDLASLAAQADQVLTMGHADEIAMFVEKMNAGL